VFFRGCVGCVRGDDTSFDMLSLLHSEANVFKPSFPGILNRLFLSFHKLLASIFLLLKLLMMSVILFYATGSTE
jgi:hypothetical protein